MDRIEKLLAFLAQSPKDNFLRHALALEYMKLGRDSQARLLLETLLADDPSYTGSYYQLAKLLEKTGDTQAAIKWYEQGMEYAKKAGERHTYNELQSALEELTFE